MPWCDLPGLGACGSGHMGLGKTRQGLTNRVSPSTSFKHSGLSFHLCAGRKRGGKGLKRVVAPGMWLERLLRFHVSSC